MQGVGGARAHGLQVEPLDQVQHLQDAEALGVRRQLPDGVAAVVGGNRRGPVAGVGGQVLGPQPAADAAHVGVHHLGQGAGVEGFASAGRQGLIGRSQGRVGPALTGARAGAVLGEDRADVVGFLDDPVRAKFVEGPHRLAPVGGDHRRDRKVVAGIGDGGGQQIGHGHAAEAAVQGEPAVDAARNRHRHRAEARQIAVLGGLGARGLQTEARRRTAGAVVAEQPLLNRIPDQGEEVAADARAGGLDET